MADQAIRTTLEQYVDAWQRGDIGGLLAAYADDVVFHYFGESDVAGTHVGKDAAVHAMVTVSGRAERELLEVVDILVGRELGTVIVRERLTRDDDVADVRRVLVYRVSDGQIAECWVLDEDQRLIDKFWRVR